MEKRIRIRLLLWLYFFARTSFYIIPSNIPRFILSSTLNFIPFYILTLIFTSILNLSFTFTSSNFSFYIIFIISILIFSFSSIFSLPNIVISSLINICFITSFPLPIKRLTCTSCTRANLSFFNSSIIRRTTSCYWH